MSELRHILSADNLAQLRESKPLFEDHRRMHKTKFLRWLELKGERLLTEYAAAGMSEADALVRVAAELQDYTAEWKAAARAKAKGRR